MHHEEISGKTVAVTIILGLHEGYVDTPVHTLEEVYQFTMRYVAAAMAEERPFISFRVAHGGRLVQGHAAGHPTSEPSAVLTATKSITYDQGRTVRQWKQSVAAFVRALTEHFRQSAVHIEYHDVEVVVIRKVLPL